MTDADKLDQAYARRYAWLRERHQALCTMQAARALGLDLSKTHVQTPEQFDMVLDAAMAGPPEDAMSCGFVPGGPLGHWCKTCGRHQYHPVHPNCKA